ncbi:DUF5818 domain-containing protein [Sphingomonas oryzagri]
MVLSSPQRRGDGRGGAPAGDLAQTIITKRAEEDHSTLKSALITLVAAGYAAPHAAPARAASGIDRGALLRRVDTWPDGSIRRGEGPLAAYSVTVIYNRLVRQAFEKKLSGAIGENELERWVPWRDSGGRYPLDLHRVPIDEVEKRVRITGVLVADDLAYTFLRWPRLSHSAPPPPLPLSRIGQDRGRKAAWAAGNATRRSWSRRTARSRS